MPVIANRVRVNCGTTGTGSVTPGSTIVSFASPAEAGVLDGDTIRYLLEDGNDFEIGTGVYSSSGPALTRAAVNLSKIGGSPGTAKINLSGASILSIIAAAEDMRDRLTEARTYYVATTGSDTNNGSSGSPFLTLQKAWNTAVKLDLNGYDVTIQIADGTYTGGVSSSIMPVGGRIIFVGNTATPSNVVISTTSADCFFFGGSVRVLLQAMRLQTTTGGNCVTARAGAFVAIDAINFHTCAGAHLFAYAGGYIENANNYTITGGAQRHLYASLNGVFNFYSGACTLTGTFAFSVAFTEATTAGTLQVITTYTVASGTITGKRYDANMNGAIQTFGGGANRFPGNSAGTTSTGAQYGN